MKSFFLTVIALIVAYAPQAAACAVCFDSGEENRLAFTVTTWFLTFTPLLFIGGVIYWLVKKVRAAEAELDEAQNGPVE